MFRIKKPKKNKFTSIYSLLVFEIFNILFFNKEKGVFFYMYEYAMSYIYIYIYYVYIFN